MSEGLWWRKVRRNVIRDDIIRTVAEELEDEALRPLVFSFYMVAYMLADDDGVFEFSPKVFRRLMYAPHTDAVVQIKDALCAEGAITNVLGGNSERIDNYFIITDWIDVQDGSKYNVRPSLTADQRRSVTARKIESERTTHYGAARVARTSRQNIVAASRQKPAGDSPVPVVRVDFSRAEDFPPAPQGVPEPPPVAENDKMAENVATQNLNDTFQKNVATRTGQDITAQDNTGQDTAVRSGAQAVTQDSTEKDTQGQSSGENPPRLPRSGAQPKAAPPSAEADSRADYTQEKGTTGGGEEAERRISRSKRLGIYEILNGFFGKFGKYALEKGEFEQFLLVCDLCYALSDAKNPPQVVAAVLTGVLKKLYPDTPVRPSDVTDPSIFLFCVEELRRILGVPDETVRKFLADYNAKSGSGVKSPKGRVAQVLAEQAISEDSG